jgi:hypothetical protein
MAPIPSVGIKLINASNMVRTTGEKSQQCQVKAAHTSTLKYNTHLPKLVARFPHDTLRYSNKFWFQPRSGHFSVHAWDKKLHKTGTYDYITVKVVIYRKEYNIGWFHGIVRW